VGITDATDDIATAKAHGDSSGHHSDVKRKKRSSIREKEGRVL
jgi:hypothetical protein